ncbi:iron ABC transporter ATP-binding protein [Paenirhodobacter populi]|uniref:ATP-binding cassette domain-containing protein n=1 Tax=Paenirhodobacter populi TaxID=2306993 RepID=A0A443K699_9RHOB|nr:ATP-binding cassette domain-containing protein [Sinirhodobacter populi]RWR12336.1 ATP-binding cassette domain-containing protein [Sinirhodobacter populi]RWR28270.1 ATP-binding cassette domain-containing protein [Sinirhodobacter populi]
MSGSGGIDVRGVTHRIHGTTILQPIDLSLPSGKVTALIGPNGAGKSTLIRLIARIDPLQTGEVTVNGLDVRQTPSARLALEMAFMGQHSGLVSRLRVRELVAFGRWPHCHGRPGPKDRAAVEKALADFDLLPLADRFMDELSGGQAQRAHLAMTVVQETPWLLLDEPLNNLDLAHARALMAHLARLRDEGRSVLIVLHDLNFASGWADHVVAMKDGRILAEGAPAEVLTEPRLSELYDTPITVGSYQGRPLILHHL